MDTTKLKRFAQFARRSLIQQVTGKLNLVLKSDSAARRELPQAVAELEKEISVQGQEEVIDRVAYIWFNRFCALRFMDVNRYNRIAILSPLPGAFQPEILAEAKMGHLDEKIVPEKTKQKVFALLDGKTPSNDPQSEAYRLLIVAVCNSWNQAMPFLFQKITDYTELLMPDDLLSGESILAYTREAMTPGVCKDVEVIGWLYQYYISEKKDEVFAALKKNKKVTPENIPAATQLFTPHWIVRYLVENSLGRLWILNNPNSKLSEKMEYYIKPETVAEDFLKISSPEEIKICDPACGSGHMLTYAFDLLYTIYEEEGYESSGIPSKILNNNLYGIEIDERAGELASFALVMKACQYDKRLLRRLSSKGELTKPNICILEKVEFGEGELKDYIDFIGHDLFTTPLQSTLLQFEQVDNFGSLIIPEMNNVGDVKNLLNNKNMQENLLLYDTHKKALQALEMTDYLSSKYHVVVANPPYMGGGNMNPELSVFAKNNYSDSKSDLFAMFIERNLELVISKGAVGMITMQSWMFLSSFEKLRNKILNDDTILSMAHLGARAFDSIGGEVVQTTAFVLECEHQQNHKGDYLRLIDARNEAEKQKDFKNNRMNGELKFTASAENFRKIPGSPIAYWVSEKMRDVFNNKKILDITISEGQTKTGNNDKYLRLIWEVNSSTIGFPKKWVKHPKGGSYRRWYGNVDCLIDWSDSARHHYRKDHVARILPEYLWWRKGFCWTLITSGNQSFRIVNDDEIFNLAAPTLFPQNEKDLFYLLGLVNTPIVTFIANLMNPTLNMNIGEIQSVPLVNIDKQLIIKGVNNLIDIASNDWGSFETSLDFTSNPLINLSSEQYITPQTPLRIFYKAMRQQWAEVTERMRRLEMQNNSIFTKAYGLQDELDSEVPWEEITLTCNPWYRYRKKALDDSNTGCDIIVTEDELKIDKSYKNMGLSRFPYEKELEKRLLADTMTEFISYSVGCMFGRYSLDIPGLVIASQGETIEDYSLKHNDILEWGISTSEYADPEDLLDATTENCSFLPDWDNVIPILDDDWFDDDISGYFREFLRVTFGENNYEENLRFIENAIGKDIRKYFLKDFYTDHVKRYKKRPIYWMFSSPSGSFNALIYMHRYQPDTISIVLNNYLREFRTKLEARLEHLEQVEVSTDSSKSEKSKALKNIDKLKKTIIELKEYEDELFIFASKPREELTIDLDDGVKANYNKFSKVLKKVTGLTGK